MLLRHDYDKTGKELAASGGVYGFASSQGIGPFFFCLLIPSPLLSHLTTSKQLGTKLHLVLMNVVKMIDDPEMLTPTPMTAYPDRTVMQHDLNSTFSAKPHTSTISQSSSGLISLIIFSSSSFVVVVVVD